MITITKNGDRTFLLTDFMLPEFVSDLVNKALDKHSEKAKAIFLDSLPANIPQNLDEKVTSIGIKYKVVPLTSDNLENIITDENFVIFGSTFLHFSPSTNLDKDIEIYQMDLNNGFLSENLVYGFLVIGMTADGNGIFYTSKMISDEDLNDIARKNEYTLQ